MKRRMKDPSRLFVSTMTLFILSGFALLAVKEFRAHTLFVGAMVTLSFYFSSALVPKIFRLDALLLSLVNFLCALGVLVLYRMDPGKGMNQAINYGAGLIAFVLCVQVVRKADVFKPLTVPVALAAMAVMILPVLVGRERGGAKAWLALGGLMFQPSEAAKVVLCIVNAYFLSKRKLLHAVIYTGLCLGILVLQKDMGTALLYFLTSLLMMYVGTGSTLFFLSGLLGAGAASVLGFTILKSIGFAHIQRRITAYVNPWGTYQNEGFQTVQSLLAVLNGGAWGLGLGAGSGMQIPVKESDSIFPFIVNEFGMVFGVLLLVIYLIIVVRSLGIALKAGRRFHALLAFGCTAFIAVQTFVIVGGNINMFPITGVTLPFISYGGSSLVSGLCLVGVLEGVASLNEQEIAMDAKLATLEDRLA